MVGGGLNGNPWGTFEYKWKENISDGVGKGRTDSPTSVITSVFCV